jgi:hypothetical protein
MRFLGPVAQPQLTVRNAFLEFAGTPAYLPD